MSKIRITLIKLARELSRMNWANERRGQCWKPSINSYELKCHIQALKVKRIGWEWGVTSHYLL